MELVSIIMAARNEEELIGQSLESLLNQSYKDIEIIVINDGSTDRTEKIVRGYMEKHKNIELITIEHNHEGCVIPRVMGIEQSKGGILFLVDADAYYAKDYIKKCVEKLNEPDVAGVVGKIRVWNPRTWFSKCRDFHYRARWDDMDNIRREIMEAKIAPWIFRRCVYNEVGGYDTHLTYGEDRDFAKKLLEKGYKIAFVPDAEWYHKWEERPLKVIKTQFILGQRNYDFIKKNKIEVLRNLYFISLIPVLLLSIAKPVLLVLLLIHVSPLYLKAIKFLKKVERDKRCAFLFPLYIYLGSCPASLGFFYKFLSRSFRKFFYNLFK